MCVALIENEATLSAQPPSTVCARRNAPGERCKTLRQLPLLALQHQYRGADAGDVSQRVRRGTGGFGSITEFVMAGLVPAIPVFVLVRCTRPGCPAQSPASRTTGDYTPMYFQP